MYLCSLDVSICAGSHRHHVGHVYSTRVTDRKHKQLRSWGLTRPIQAHLACTPIKIWMQSLMQICSHKHIMSTHKLVHTCTWVSTDFLAFYQSRAFSESRNALAILVTLKQNYTLCTQVWLSWMFLFWKYWAVKSQFLTYCNTFVDQRKHRNMLGTCVYSALNLNFRKQMVNPDILKLL